jgi:RND family efflux transporter MFP subunit
MSYSTKNRSFPRSTAVGLACAVVITTGLSGALHLRAAQSVSTEVRAPMPVAAIGFVTESEYSRSTSLLGLVEANRSAVLGFELPGMLSEVRVREGSVVAAGDTLATLDDGTLRSARRAILAQLQQAESQLELAQLNAKRQRELVETGAVSRERFDETRLTALALSAQVDVVRAELSKIELDLEKSQLRAPYAGVIALRYLDEGSIVSAGVPVLRLIETGAMEAHIGVPVELTRTLIPGKEYSLEIRGTVVQAKLSAVRPDIDPYTRSVTSVFMLPENTLVLHGEAVTLELSRQITEEGGWLPVSALLEGQRGIWNVLRLEEVGQQIVSVREVVEVLEIQGDHAYVRGSIVDGQQIIAAGVHRIAPGTAVTPLEG